MKPNQENSLDGLFRQGFDGEESTPPSAAWAQMEALLDAQQTGGQKKKRGFIWWSAAAALLPLLMAGIWWMQSGQSITDMAQVAGKQKVPTAIGTSANDPMPLVKAADPAAALLPDAKSDRSSLAGTKLTLVQNRPDAIHTQRIQKELEKSLVVNSSPDTMKQNPVEWETTTRQSDYVAVEKNFEKNNVNQEFEMAVIEIRPSRKEPMEEIATIEWKRSSRPKISLAESYANIKSGNLGKIPGVMEAKDNLVAFLGFRK